MATSLTRNQDTLTGTAGNDLFLAPTFTTELGTQVNTLQTFDRINGLGGIDTLRADIIVGNQFGQFSTVRPTLTSVENVELTAVQADDGFSQLVFNLGNSTGTTNVSSVDSDATVTVINARATNQFTVDNFDGDVFGNRLAFDAQGITGTSVTFNVIGTQSDFDGEGFNSSPVIAASRSNGSDLFSRATVNVTASEVEVGFSADVLQLNTRGSGNQIDLVNPVERVVVGGSGQTTINFLGDDEDGEGFGSGLGRSFDASGKAGGITVNNIFGSAVSVRGTSSNDVFNGVSSSQRLTLDLGAGADRAVDIDGSNGLDLRAGAGNDQATVTALNNDERTTDRIDMGDGNDTLILDDVDLDLTFDEANGVDVVNGGTGTNTIFLELNAATLGADSVLSAAEGANIVNFQRFVITEAVSGATVDLDGLPDVTTVFNQDGDADLTFDGVRSGMTFSETGVVNDEGGTDVNNTITLNANGIEGPNSTDLAAVNLAVGGGAAVATTFDVNGFNTVNLAVRSGVNAEPNDITVNTDGAAADPDSLVITGSGDVDLRSTENGFTTVNASAATGDVDMTGGDGDVGTSDEPVEFNGVVLGDAAVTVTGGTGDDSLVGGNLGDTFDLGRGGQDGVYFLTDEQSDFNVNNLDTVNGFDVSGNDTLVFNGVQGQLFTGELENVTAVRSGTAADNPEAVELVFLGNVNSDALAFASIDAFDTDNGTGEDYGAIFNTENNTLYIDTNSDGAIDDLDTAIIINGKSALSTNDFALTYFDDAPEMLPNQNAGMLDA